MGKVRIASFCVSLDGYGAGLEQSLETPLGRGGEALFGWAFGTKTFCAMQGREGGSTGVDDDFARRGFENVGAWILGRNMFGPIRGSWGDGSWKGWWGASPPYRVPVFVLTHHARADLPMEGGTTFHFVTEGIHAALERARAAANGKDVRIGGGVSTLRQFAQAGLVDEIHLAISPLFFGRGENLFAGMDWGALGFRCVTRVQGEHATHVVLVR
jgi:dihydrofolate reductase